MDDKRTEEPEGGKVIPMRGLESLHDASGVNSYAMPMVASPFESVTSEIMDPQQVAQDLKDRIKYIEKQELVTAAKAGAPTKNLIDILVAELAEEISHIKWERRDAAKRGYKTEKLTSSRISGLKNLADILLKKRDTIGDERLSTKDPRVQQFFKLWMEMFFAAMEKMNIPPEMIDLVFSQIKADMLEWEIKMESVDAKQ